MKKLRLFLTLLSILILSFLSGCVASSSTLNTSKTESTTNSVTTTSTAKETKTITLINKTDSIEEYYDYHDFNANMLINGDVDDLIQAVYTILNEANICVIYSDSKKHFHGTDKDPNNSSNFLLFYSGISVTEWDGDNYMSREHVWPQSLGHSKTEPGGHDLYNLRPEHHTVNEKRGDKVFGNVTTSKTTLYYPGNNSIICGWYNGTTFEPPDEVKGDVARICFYYSIKYKFDLSIITSDDTYQEFLEWNLMDPPSKTELDRNDYIQGIQGNRNIFVDYPELANYIWGSNN